MIMLSEIAKALNAKMRGADVEIKSVGTDSRSILQGQMFIGIKGENFDGNAYAADALKHGAAAVLLSDECVQASPAVLVDDTRLALGELGHYWRNKFRVPLVAVTGSNGKTTVKEMIAAILKASGGKVLATRGNLNNDLGVPLTLLGLNQNHTYAVIEMGMNHEGEIRYLTKLARPNIALVNNAGTAHIGELGSREAIARAKGEIYEGLSDDGIALINADDRFANYWRSLNQARRIMTFGIQNQSDVSASFESKQQLSEITLNTPTGKVQFCLQVPGEHNVRNALAAATVAVALGVDDADIAAGLSQFSPVKGRLNWLQGKNGAVVIDDTYNANPDSMKVAIDVLTKQPGTRIFVMGDMAELGADTVGMHAEIGAYAKEKGVDLFYSLGELTKHANTNFGKGAIHFDSLESLHKGLAEHLQKEVTVLIKGSRFMKMERVVNAITKRITGMEAH